MHYKIVHDEKALRDFIDWLPELLPHERYYVSLFAREKYRIHPTTRKLPRSVATNLISFESTKQDLFYKIKRLECPIGSFYHDERLKSANVKKKEEEEKEEEKKEQEKKEKEKKEQEKEEKEEKEESENDNDTKEIPQEMLALYIQPNPRNLTLATRNLTKLMVNLFATPNNEQKIQEFNPVSVIRNEVGKTGDRKLFVDFDFDEVDLEETRKRLSLVVNLDAATFIKSKNGFHVMVEPIKVQKQFSSTWYRNIISMEGMDYVKNSESMVPVPGTVQGGFVPYMIVDF